MPLCLMLTVDSNGQSQIVGALLMMSETEEAIRKMVQAFKRENSSWSSTKVVTMDKDFTEQPVF